MRTTNTPGLVDQYVHMICKYVNKARDPPVLKSPSCLMFTSNQFEETRRSRRPPETAEAHAKAAMRKLGFKNMAMFRELDFLFIPYIKYITHSVLVGIAPKQRFAFVIDSGPEKYNISHDLSRSISALILTLSPDIKWARDNKRPQQGEWRMYGEWSHRSQTTDDGPNAAQQDDEYNCGVFTATSAMCLAFGFRLNCFVEGDLDKRKKPRMAAEFANGGFFGPGFDYDLLDLPQIGVQPPPSPKAPAYTAPKPHATPTAQPSTAPKRKQSILRRFFSKKRKHDGSGGDREQRGLGEDDSSESEGSDGESDDEDSLPIPKEPLYTPEQVFYALNLTPKTTSKKRKNAVAYPPQFDSKVHQQAILIYDIPEEFNLQDRNYSKRELKQACRDFRVVDWKPWSFERQGFFMKFVMSEIGAIMARRRGDEIQPFPGIGEVPELIPATAPIRVQPRRSVKRSRQEMEYHETRVHKRRG
ncbi:uncharacterized protein LY89DRAFT_732428 [Mollisia scopiformis]|uniref:Ubiquitin-like protease family profile domain-containing protein n=1 Tax=Mollisia scopiformis TaxID=149040 RepID=A0A194XFH7_MOLSC|nr:uncharacterized protein LY89DRAFT_732428 [Mollisia scopiformis]KUJ18889.1 hypothetical protein LY89DRAFT_732428 [Mollisia scopiformis]